MSGCTCVVVLVVAETLYIANVGDSRAIIGEERNGKLIAFPLSSDQTCARRRIEVPEADALRAPCDSLGRAGPSARTSASA